MRKFLLAALTSLLFGGSAVAGEIEDTVNSVLGSAAFIGVEDLARIIERQSISGVANLAALRAINVSELRAETVFVRGYTTDGDYPGMSYRFDPTCTTADNLGTRIEPTFGDGCWKMVVLSGIPVDIRAFGAVVFDDDVTAIDDAEDASDAFDRAFDAGVAGEIEAIWLGIPYKTTQFALAYAVTRPVEPSGSTSVLGPGSDYITIHAKSTFVDSSDEPRVFSTHARDGSTQEHVTYRGFLVSSNVTNVRAIGPEDDVPNDITGGGGANEWTDVAAVCGAVVDYCMATLGTIGSTFNRIVINTVGGGGALLHGASDLTYILSRFSCVNLTGACIATVQGNVNFINTFLSVGNYGATVTTPKWFIQLHSTGQVFFDGLFIETNGLNDANKSWLGWLFASTGNSLWGVQNLVLNCGSTGFPNAQGFARIIPNNSAGRAVTINGFQSDANALCQFPAVIDFWTPDHVNYKNQTLSPLQVNLVNADDAGRALVKVEGNYTGTNADITGDPLAALYFTGNFRGQALNHLVTSDATVATLTHVSPTIISKTGIDAISANAAKIYIQVPEDVHVQQIVGRISGALATGDMTITWTHEKRADTIASSTMTFTQSGSAAGDKVSVTPARTNDGDVVLNGGTLIGTIGGTNDASGVTVDVDVHVGPTPEYASYGIRGAGQIEQRPPENDANTLNAYETGQSIYFTIDGSDGLTVLTDIGGNTDLEDVDGQPLWVDAGAATSRDSATFTQGAGHMKTGSNQTVAPGETWFWVGKITTSLPGNDEVLFAFDAKTYVQYDVSNNRLEWTQNEAAGSTTLSTNSVEDDWIVIAVKVTSTSVVTVRLGEATAGLRDIITLDPHDDIIGGDEPLRIGGLADAGTNSFTGIFGEFRRYDNAMTDFEIEVVMRDLMTKWAGKFLKVSANDNFYVLPMVA